MIGCQAEAQGGPFARRGDDFELDGVLPPHACEGPIGGIATVHVDAACPNFLVQEICSGVKPEM
ncbi:MAG: hypothetical protein FJW30_20905, partial [Acidobacteria bacterium]|nr:hypothetical protein [Acidobacteriota bacterium]